MPDFFKIIIHETVERIDVRNARGIVAECEIRLCVVVAFKNGTGPRGLRKGVVAPDNVDVVICVNISTKEAYPFLLIDGLFHFCLQIRKPDLSIENGIFARS